MTFHHFLSDQPMRSKFLTAVLVLFCPLLGSTTASAAPLRVPEEEAKKAIVSKSAPTVPQIARQIHLSGKVLVDLTVSEDGSVEKADVVSGNPVLGGAAVAAGKKWMFKPFLVDGKAEKALVRVTFDFSS